jgi:hypothetical protein
MRALVLALALWAGAAEAQVQTDPAGLREIAVRLLVQGEAGRSAELARALLARDPDDRTALVVLAAAAPQAAGRPRGGGRRSGPGALSDEPRRALRGGTARGAGGGRGGAPLSGGVLAAPRSRHRARRGAGGAHAGRRPRGAGPQPVAAGGGAGLRALGQRQRGRPDRPAGGGRPGERASGRAGAQHRRAGAVGLGRHLRPARRAPPEGKPDGADGAALPPLGPQRDPVGGVAGPHPRRGRGGGGHGIGLRLGRGGGGPRAPAAPRLGGSWGRRHAGLEPFGRRGGPGRGRAGLQPAADGLRGLGGRRGPEPAPVGQRGGAAVRERVARAAAALARIWPGRRRCGGRTG